MADPDPKVKPRGERRYRRKVASPKQWAAIRAEKLDRCRACFVTNEPLQLHHLVSRAQHGDDVAANLVPLCRYCHAAVTNRRAEALAAVARRLEDDEYAYVISKLGEGAMERLFSV